jgi:PHD/YefM family antitoxin component YafN of YafNO toxin-antitoxin module
MKWVTASELVRNFGEWSDVAIHEPVIITRNGRERLVLLNVDRFNELEHDSASGAERRSERQTRDRASQKSGSRKRKVA